MRCVSARQRSDRTLHHSLFKMAIEPVSPPQLSGPDLRLYELQELRMLPPLPEQVAGMLTAESIAALVGKSGAGKTFVALSLALSIASGRAFFGRPVQQSAVLYIAAEGQQTLINRIDAALSAWGIEADPPIYVMRHVFDLMTAEDVERVCAAIESQGVRPGLVVLDPLASFVAGSTDRMADIAAMNRTGLIAMRDRLRATILLVVHAGWEGERERGSSHLRDIMDTTILVTAKE